VHVSLEHPGHSLPRLLQIVHALYPQRDGDAGLFTWEAARALGGVVLSFTAAPSSFPEWNGLDVRTSAPGESPLLALNRVLSEVQPQVVLVQHLGELSPSLLMGLRERGIPYAVVMHDWTPLCPTHRLWHSSGQPCSGPARAGLKCALCISGTWKRAAEVPLRTFRYRHRPQDWQIALVRADAILVTSRFQRDLWIEQGAPPEQLAVLAPTLLQPTEPATPTHNARPTALYAGGWDEAEGVELLAAAAEDLRSDWQFVCPGTMDDTTRQDLRAAFEERHELQTSGPLTPAQLQAAVRRSDVVVIPSRWQPSWSRIAAIAESAGRPVVATAVGGIPERIVHGVNGYLAAPDMPPSLTQSLEEAIASPWDPAAVQAHAQAEARASLDKLRRLLRLMAGGEEEHSALALEFGDFLEQAAAVFELSAAEVRSRLTHALRDLSPWLETAQERALFLAVDAHTRRRQLALNHAMALFHAAGCHRVLDLQAGLGDAARSFRSWGLDARIAEPDPALALLAERLGAQHAEPEFAADGVFVNLGCPDDHPKALRTRFPHARVIALETEEGVETVER
jgi:glycosyltransferase involved in cell wall biosynthesis